MPYGMSGTSGMMGMGMGLGPMAGYYSGSNMAASLLAQSKSNFGKSEFLVVFFFGFFITSVDDVMAKIFLRMLDGVDFWFYFSFILIE